MKTLFVLVAIIFATSQAFSILNVALEEWNSYKAEFNKDYSFIEDTFRMRVFFYKKREIAKHNYKYYNGLVPFKMAVNQFTDYMRHELVSMLNGYNRTKFMDEEGKYHHLKQKFIVPENTDLPKSIDWREKGAVTPIKSQKACGCCWAFAATGALEGQHFLQTGKLVSLSEQNLVDCTADYGTAGCDGGIIELGFIYTKDNKGIDTEAGYPYEAKVGTCRYSPEFLGAQDRGYIEIESGNEEQLKAAVATVGPVAAAIDASHDSIFSYTGGMYYEPKCSTTTLDHAVLIVGYGTEEDGRDYWLVKNSWGEKWGENGYMKVPRNQNNYCGIATQASYPLL